MRLAIPARLPGRAGRESSDDALAGRSESPTFTAAGLAAGIAIGYLLHASRDARRRSIVRAKAGKTARTAADAARGTARDLTNRSRGLVARTRQAFDRDTPDDRILEERIRAELGFLVSHPHAITVSAERGCATLSGLILEDEVKPLIRGVTRVRGVKEVRNRLQPHEHADDIPSLQGGERKPAGRRFALRQQYWSPGPRLLTGAAGATLAMYGKRRRGLAGAGLRAVGLGLFARSATNQPLRRLTGVGAGRRAIDIRKTINVAAPIEQVFAFWTDYENFPRFMTHVREVHRADGAGRAEGAAEEERSHWRVEGPGGIGLRYDAVVTKKEPPEWFAWRSERSTLLRHAGIVHLAPTASGGTRIEVRLSYNPPAGALGHVVAHILGADPKRQMDDDLLRMKTLLETGRPPHDAAQPGGEQLVRH